MGLFSTPDQDGTRDQEPQHVLPAVEDQDDTPGAPGHPDYPQWEEGATAPRLYERPRGWTPGNYPPGREDDPPEVIGDRYASHVDLWRAVTRWEQEQDRLDRVAAGIRRRVAQQERDAAEHAAEVARATADREHAAAEHAARLDRLTAAAEVHGMSVIVDQYDGAERVRLTAAASHPATGRLFPWEPPVPQVYASGSVVIARAGDTLAEVERFVEEWPRLLRDAQRSTPHLRRQMIDALRQGVTR